MGIMQSRTFLKLHQSSSLHPYPIFPLQKFETQSLWKNYKIFLILGFLLFHVLSNYMRVYVCYIGVQFWWLKCHLNVVKWLAYENIIMFWWFCGSLWTSPRARLFGSVTISFGVTVELNNKMSLFWCWVSKKLELL